MVPTRSVGCGTISALTKVAVRNPRRKCSNRSVRSSELPNASDAYHPIHESSICESQQNAG